MSVACTNFCFSHTRFSQLIYLTPNLHKLSCLQKNSPLIFRILNTQLEDHVSRVLCKKHHPARVLANHPDRNSFGFHDDQDALLKGRSSYALSTRFCKIKPNQSERKSTFRDPVIIWLIVRLLQPSWPTRETYVDLLQHNAQVRDTENRAKWTERRKGPAATTCCMNYRYHPQAGGHPPLRISIF